MGDSSIGGGKRLGTGTLGVGVAAVAVEAVAGAQQGAVGGGSF